MALIIFLALAGAIFICLEIILPGMILGIGGFIAIAASLVMTFTTDDLAGLSGGGRALVAACILLGCLIIIGLWLKYFDRTAIGRKLVLGSGGVAKIDYADAEQLLGIKGTALTDLRPSGRVKMDGLPKTCDVIAETGFIESGSEIVVVKVEGRRVLVRQSS